MKEHWFEHRGSSRLFPVHWKGWVSATALFGLLALGAKVDDALRPGDTLVYVLAMAPLCVAALALAWMVTDRIKRKR
jgi:hypothetical protein